MEIGRGTISSIMGQKDFIVDLIPVDVVCNTIITAGWSNSFTRSNITPVYHCTSGQVNPITWQNYGKITLKHAREYPTKYTMLYPNFSYRTNRFAHWIIEIFLHFLPAIFFDIFLMIQRRKPMMLKIAKRFKLAADTGEFFAMHQWNFDIKNLKRIISAAQQTQHDSQEFNCDMSNMDWDDYVKNHMLGIRKYVLKDDLSSLTNARRKLRNILWVKRGLQLFLVLSIYYIFFRDIFKS